MPHTKSWPHVYPGLNLLPAPQVSRIGANVLKADTAAIVSVAANSSIISHIIQHAIHHTAEYVRDHDLTYLDCDRFVEYLCKRTFDCALTDAASQDVTGRASQVHDGATNAKAIAAVSGQTATDDVRSGGSKRGSTRPARTSTKR